MTHTFELTDEKDRKLPVTVVVAGTFLNIFVEGYGNQVSLDWYDDKLRLLVNADPQKEEPEITELEPVVECKTCDDEFRRCDLTVLGNGKRACPVCSTQLDENNGLS